MTSFSSVYRSMIAIAIVSCSFVISVSAAGTIPRDSLRLELSLATGSLDTSGNNRPVTATGVAPTYQIDPIYGIPYAQFNGSGGLRVNTAWSATDDFAISFWINENSQKLAGNTSNNIVKLPSPIYLPTPWNSYYTTQLLYDKPQVIFSAKSGYSDTSALRLAISKDGVCSLNSNSVFSPGDYWNGYMSRKTDTFGTLQTYIQCPSIIDGKWHHIIIQKKIGKMEILIDGNSVWTAIENLTLTKNITLGGMGFTIDTSTYTPYYPDSVIKDIAESSSYRGGMAGVRMYNKSLSLTEIEALGDEYRYAQSDLIGAGNITLKMNGYTTPNLSISLSGIAPNLSKEIVEYQYSLSGSSFLPITSITDISASTGSLQYRVTLNMSSAKDGKNTVTLRVKSGDTYQNLGTVTFTKLDTLGTITINQPNTDIAPLKMISASTDIGNVLYMFQTRGTVCDGTITTWEDYSDLTFTSKGDNGVRICYKSVNPASNKNVYKLSATIQGIQSTEDQKEKGFGLFSNYTLWAKSTFPKSDDSTAMILELLNSAKQRSDNYVGGVLQSYSLSSGNNITMTDINGDGLVDFLYSSSDPVRRAILVNNGNYTFKTVYKCAMDILSAAGGYWSSATGIWVWIATPATYTYYGDCADPTR